MEMDVQAVTWLILLIVLLAAEAITLGLTTIWFAGGALAAFCLAVAGLPLPVQIAAFCVISVLLLLFTRPAASRWLNSGRIRTNAGSLIGETAVVTERIHNLENSGQVQVRGQYWTARAAAADHVIEAGKQVIIEEIRGVKLIVKEVGER